jgi:hypothetical protein
MQKLRDKKEFKAEIRLGEGKASEKKKTCGSM